MLRIKLKELAPIVIRAYAAGSNVLLMGEPAMGKTYKMKEIAQKMRERIPEFQFWDVYCPDWSPLDIQATMPDAASKSLVTYVNSLLPNGYKTPDAKGILFLDEMLNTDPTTLKLLQKYVNGEDMSGLLIKPKGVIVVAAANRMEDKSGAMQQYRAFLSRWMHVHVYTDSADNIEYATEKSWHPRVQDFFKHNPECINNYMDVFFPGERKSGEGKRLKDDSVAMEEGKAGVWAHMRGWERVSNTEYAADDMGSNVEHAEVLGSIGTGPGMKYMAHREYMGRLVSLEEILKHPKTADIPSAIDELYAVCTMVALRCKEDDLPKVKMWGERVPLDLQVMMIRRMWKRENFTIIGTKTYIEWMSNKKLSDLLMTK